MDDPSQDDFADAVQDRSALLRGQWAAAVASVLDAQDRDGLPISSTFAQHLAEISYAWATTSLAPDLEAFARHGNRATIGVADVLLAARKNDTTHMLIEREADRIRPEKKQKVETDKK